MEPLSIEIIEFCKPTENVKSLYIGNIPAQFEEQQLWDLLHNFFSPFGLLHEVKIVEASTSAQHVKNLSANMPPVKQSFKPYYAFVKFYSAMAAAKAKAGAAGKLFLKGQHLKVQYSSRKVLPKQRTLYYSQCYELADHYFGFNGWNCRILKMKEMSVNAVSEQPCVQMKEMSVNAVSEHPCVQMKEMSVNAVSEQPCVQMLCAVKLDFPRWGLTAHGLRPSESMKWTRADPSSRGLAFCRARKQSFRLAVQDAFSKVILVVLSSGKVYVEVDTTAEEQIFMEEDSDTACLLKVNEVDYSLDEDEADQEFVDAINRQILQDLLNETA